MFGSRARTPRPLLLLIVYGLFLVIVGITATAQTVLVSLHFSVAALSTSVGGDAATVRTVVNRFLEPDDFAGPLSADRIVAVEQMLIDLRRQGEIIRVDIRDPDGLTRFSTEPAARGEVAPITPTFQNALAGNVDAMIVQAGEATEAPGPAIGAADLLREYFPLITADGETTAVVALWRDAQPILDRLEGTRRDVVLVTLSAAIIVSILLFLIFRSAQGRITRQTAQLVEATRRDPLTGMLNHGALVGELAVAIESARSRNAPIGVALLDLDNFKLLNDTHGHSAGDEALLRLGQCLTDALPGDATCGRYGPDEFLVIAPAGTVVELEPMVDGLRHTLVDASLQFDASERLPITISAGIATFPDDAASVTELLSSVAVVLAEAKAGGGDAVRVAGRTPEATSEQKTFDILQGLVFAVDTKDRYTKRHSEDVARYGAFLARELGLDPAFVDTVKRAGLLHDVGKIGIPDGVLRKPGHLTSEEYEIVKQHVALGDSIVRNVDHVDAVRAGIRHHHERWDGRGYLHALAGEDIPLIARILAVGDAFSAMTTTRPYRKALSVEEAIRRLGDAAGTQLDERLVVAFIHGLEGAADAPMPGVESPTGLWVASIQVA